jgi:hypothetical protein
MTSNRPIYPEGRRCECGALTEGHARACHKCRSRARWLRRKARRDETAHLHPESGTPNARRR